MRTRVAAPVLVLLLAAAGRAAAGDAPPPPFVSKVPGVGPVPAALRERLALSPFYEQHVDASGLPVLASRKVDGRALLEAKHIVEGMIGHRPGIFAALAKRKVRVVVMAPDEFTTDVPEHSDLDPKDYWDRRARGLGATPWRPAVSSGEENLLGYPGDPYTGESILVHEFGHTIHELAIEPPEARAADGFDARLRAAYRDAIGHGLWKGSYASTNASEYWAEGVQSWFDANRSDDQEHNEVDTREELGRYDAGLAKLCAEAFGDREWRWKPAGERVPPSPHLAGPDLRAGPRFTWDLLAHRRKPPALAVPAPGLLPLPALAEAARPEWISPRSGGGTSILFRNGSAREVAVEWIDFEGKPRPYHRLLPGGTANQTTFEGHVFRVRSDDGRILAYFVAEGSAGEARVHGK